MTIVYAREQTLSVEDYTAVIGSTYMAGHRPLGNPGRVAEVLAGSNVIVTAREETGGIVGLARGICDNAWVCYLADLAVSDGHQRKGIGSALLRAVKENLGPRIGVVLIAYPEAVAYYRKIGLPEMTAFYVDREDRT